MSRDPLPLSCLFTGDSEASVQPWWTWQVVPLAVCPSLVPLAVCPSPCAPRLCPSLCPSLCPLPCPAGSAAAGLQSPGSSDLRLPVLNPVGKFPIAAWPIPPPCVTASGGSGVSPLSQPPVPWKSSVIFALSHAGVRTRFYPAHCPDRLCCILGPLGMDTGGNLNLQG